MTMITRISKKPSVSLKIFAFESGAYCVLNVTASSVVLRSQAMKIAQTDHWDVEAFNRLVLLQQAEMEFQADPIWKSLSEARGTFPNYHPQVTAVGLQPYPDPPNNEKIRISSPVQYCREWDEYYRLRGEYEAALERYEKQLREQHAKRFAELERINGDLSYSSEVRALFSFPIPMISAKSTEERSFALYRDCLWSARRNLEPDQWGILIDRYIQREDAELLALLRADQSSVDERERVSSAVRRAVWSRDQGKCARCGSRERLEYDHIIPVAHGGGSTERNIELLCERCNRAKSDSIY